MNPAQIGAVFRDDFSFNRHEKTAVGVDTFQDQNGEEAGPSKVDERTLIQNENDKRIQELEEKLQIALNLIEEKDSLIKDLLDKRQMSQRVIIQDDPLADLMRIQDPFETTHNTPENSIGGQRQLSSLELDEEARALHILTHKVLGNSLLLYLVLSKLDSKTVFKVRLVSKLWSNVGASVTRSRSAVRINFKYDNESKCFHRDFNRCRISYQEDMSGSGAGSRLRSQPQLSFLSKCIKSCGSHKFPCTNFSFRSISNVGQCELKKFLKLYGDRIRTLDLSFLAGFSWNSYSWRRLRIILLVQCRNLHKLDLFFGGRLGVNESLDSTNNYSTNLLFPEAGTCLPSLNVLSLSGFFIGARELLLAAYNLTNFYVSPFTPSIVEVLISCGKAHTIKNMYYNPTPNNLVPCFEAFAKARPKLTSINLTGFNGDSRVNVEGTRAFYRKAARVLSLILDESKDTLEEMDLKMTSRVCMSIIWPTFSRLRKLRLDEDDGVEEEEQANAEDHHHNHNHNHNHNENNQNQNGEGHHDDNHSPTYFDFPTSFTSRVFPALESIQIFPIIESGGLIESFLMNVEKKSPLLKMREFDFNTDLPILFAERLPIVFPNLEVVNTLLLCDFLGDWGKFLWKLKKLKKLNLNLDTRDPDYCRHSFPQLDHCLTGMSKNIIRKLQNPNFARKMARKWGDDVPRINPSIVDCQELKALHVRFMSSLDQLPEAGYRFFSFVTGEFALRFLPQLKCTMTAGGLGDPQYFQQWRRMVDEALEPMVPFCEEIIIQGRP